MSFLCHFEGIYQSVPAPFLICIRRERGSAVKSQENVKSEPKQRKFLCLKGRIACIVQFCCSSFKTVEKGKRKFISELNTRKRSTECTVRTFNAWQRQRNGSGALPSPQPKCKCPWVSIHCLIYLVCFRFKPIVNLVYNQCV